MSISINQADNLAVVLSKQLDQLHLDVLARESQFVRRQSRKINVKEFLLSLFVITVMDSSSLCRWAQTLGMMIRKRLSKQAIHERINASLVEFIKMVLQEALLTKVKGIRTRKLSELSSRFKRVFVEDATHISLSKALAKYYPGSYSHTCPASTLKIQSRIDLLNERFHSFDITAFTDNDQKASGTILKHIQKGDLLIRDLGYFVIKTFLAIQQREAYFISRYRYGVTLWNRLDTKQLNLAKRLRSGQTLDLWVLMGKIEKLPVRLVAIPLPENVAQERRRKAKRNRDRRCKPDADHLKLLGWLIMITNVESAMLSAKEIAELYEIRWRIETIFKTWKSHFHITHVPNVSVIRIESHIYAILLFITLFHAGFLALCYHKMNPTANRQLSLFKLSQFISCNIWVFIFSIYNSDDITDIIIDQISYHCIYDIRTNRKNYMEKLASLT